MTSQLEETKVCLWISLFFF